MGQLGEPDPNGYYFFPWWKKLWRDIYDSIWLWLNEKKGNK